jgi:hypothetical protein
MGSVTTTFIAHFASTVFAMLIVALVAGRFGLLFLRLRGKRDAAIKWSRAFNRLTAYLQP